MPVASDPALKLAVQTRYLQGYKPFQIHAELGVKAQTIKTWAQRGGWTHAVASVNAKAESTIAEAKGEVVASALDKHSNTVRAALAADLQRSVELVQASPPTTLPGALKRQQALEPLIRNAKTVFGWESQQSSSPVRVQILAQTCLVSDSSQPVTIKHPFPVAAQEGGGGADPFQGGGVQSITPPKYLEVLEVSSALTEPEQPQDFEI